MTDILCKWLNEEVRVTRPIAIDGKNFSQEFSSGYLIGEILYKHGLQDDFSSFSKTSTADSKLNNFTRMEPTMALLGIPFDTNMAKDIMDEKPGFATRLIYQLFIALGRKTKSNLTGVAMETMRPAGPANLSQIETGLFKERLKTIVPRQVDLNFDSLVKKYHGWQKDQEDKAFQEKLEGDEKLKKYQQKTRQKILQKSRNLREKQEETRQKIKEATVQIPKPIAKKSGKARETQLKERTAETVFSNINNFETSLKAMPPPMSPLDMDRSAVDTDIEIFLNSTAPAFERTMGKPVVNDDYVARIRKRLEEDAKARKEREKRRRRVLVQQLKSHEAQQEAHREEMLVNRLMRQSQMERRIAVQLMHVRHEKEVIKKNRMLREQQFAERRLKDFTDALDRESEMCRLAKIEYESDVQHSVELHTEIAAEKAKKKYAKHYNSCKDILLNIVDFSCKVGEYRELTEKLLPPKLVREWKALFVDGMPLYPTAADGEVSTTEVIDVAEEEQEVLLDEEDFKEYKTFEGEWSSTKEGTPNEPPKDNNILGHILHRMFAIVAPPEPTPPPPEFPPCPLKISVVGKYFTGKSSAIQRILTTHRIVSIHPDELVEDAIEAFKNRETIVLEESTEELKGNTEESGEESGAKIIAATEQDGDATTVKEDGESPGDNAMLSVTPSGSKTNESAKSEKDGSTKTFGSFQSLKSDTSSMMFTSRAKLGNKAFVILKKGKPMPDALLVDIIVEAVRNIPEGTGWILDGFPSTISQAKLLEKALTGYESTTSLKQTTKEGGKKTKKSKLVSDPHPPAETSSPKSGLDLVCLFDLEDEVILRRAEGRTYDPSSADEFHQEYNPPPEGSHTGTLTQTKVQPVLDPNNDREQVQSRLANSQDTLPKLEKWYGKFGVLMKIDANKARDDLFEEFRNIVEETLIKVTAPPPEDKSKELEEIVAQEPQPEPLPDVKPEPVSDAPPSPTSETKSVKSALKSSKSNSPKTSKKGGKKEDRPVSSKGKKEDRAASSKSKKGDRAASAKGKKDRTPSPNKKDDKGARKKTSRSPSPKAKGSRSDSKAGSRPGSRGRRSPNKEPEVEVVPEIQEPPEPEPGTSEWEYVEEPIDEELAHVLVDQWGNIEDNYLRTSKHVFRKIRQEREIIYRYLYKRRKDFAEYLKRPDAKQEFVAMWQKEYNDTAIDMRDDEDTKGELHQRLEDLCERLWNICDTRKEDAEREREQIMKEGWLEDHLGLLTNHYISLMQEEVNRYQETAKLLKDYYVGMEGGLGPKKSKVLPNGVQSFSRIPLVELPTTLPPGVEADIPSQDSKPLSARPSKERDVKTPEAEEKETNQNRIPLVPRRPKSGDVTGTWKEMKAKKSTPRREMTKMSEEKLDSPIPPADPDEKLLFDALQAALHAIELQVAAGLAEEEAEAQRLADLEREREKELFKILSKDKRGKKDGRRSKSKSGASPAKAMVSETPTPVPPEETIDQQKEEEEKRRKAKIRERLLKEYKYSIMGESEGLKVRLERVKAISTAVVLDLKAKAQGSYEDMNDWLGQRFLQEMESIDSMTKLARLTVEKESKIQDAIVLEDKELIIDYDLKRFKTPTPPPPPSPKEEAKPDKFTVVQLLALHEQFIEIAPTGLISVKAFCDTMLDLASCTIGTEGLPDNWMSISANQLQDVASMLSADNEYLDWKTFLLAAAKPWPPASVDGLLETLKNFQEVDDLKINRVGKENFEKIHVWFSDEEEDITSYAEDGYNRLKELHSAFFDIFSDYIDGWFSVNYVDMLLYFCATEDPLEGFLRALSLVTGITLPTKEEIDALENQESPEQHSLVIPDPLLTPIVLEDILKVFNHSKRIQGDSHRFSTTTDPLDSFSEERLTGIYEELGGGFGALPIYLLFQHPVMRDCITMCRRFQSIDLQSILKNTET